MYFRDFYQCFTSENILVNLLNTFIYSNKCGFMLLLLWSQRLLKITKFDSDSKLSKNFDSDSDSDSRGFKNIDSHSDSGKFLLTPPRALESESSRSRSRWSRKNFAESESESESIFLKPLESESESESKFLDNLESE